MNTIEVPGITQIFQIPSSWDELSRSQVLQILKYAALFLSDEMDLQNFTVLSFYTVADVKRNWLSVVKERLLSDKQLEEKFENVYIYAQQLTKFLFKEWSENGEQKIEFHYNTPLNHIPYFKARGVKYFGPKDMLADLTFGEFSGAIDSMNVYFASKDVKDLDKFILKLYRPAGKDGNRLPWSEDHAQRQARRIRKVPAYIKIGILLWFSTCVNYIKTEELTISGKKVKLASLFPKAKSGERVKASGLGWTSIQFSVAKEGVFGPIDQTNARNLYEVLLFIYDIQLQNKKAKPGNKGRTP